MGSWGPPASQGMPGLDILWGSPYGAAPWFIVHWLLTRLLVSPDTSLGAQVLEITVASRSEMDWFLSVNFPLMSIFLDEEVKITYFEEGEADMGQKTGLL